MEKFISKIIYLFYLLIQTLLACVPTDTGWHLYRDVVAVNSPRIFRMPFAAGARDLETIGTGHSLINGKWGEISSKKTFPEVVQVYSWARNDNFGGGPWYVMFKNDMGKYGWWRTSGSGRLRDRDISNHGTGGKWARVRARFDTLTGDCSHKMHYRHPYLIIICYNQNAIHNTLNQAMVYDYYIDIHNGDNPGNDYGVGGNSDNDFWPISNQHYMNSTMRAGNTDGEGPINVDFNHRVHTTTIRTPRTGAYSGSNGNTWWTLTWNGPYDGQMSSTGRHPNPGGASTATPLIKNTNIIFLRPFSDKVYLKMCRITGLGGMRVITQIVQPDPGNGRGDQNLIYIVYMKGTNYALSRCTINNGDINRNFKVPPFGVGNVNCFDGCTDVPLGGFGANGVGSISQGGLRYVPGTNGNDIDYLVGYDQDLAGGGANGKTGRIFRCQINRISMAISNCVSGPRCPTPRSAFGYFSDCRRSDASCGIYYMYRQASGTGLMDRVSCVDILRFNANQPLSYRKHFTAVHAFDSRNVVFGSVDSAAESQSTHSRHDFYVYNSRETLPTDANKVTTWSNKVGRYHDRNAVTFYDYPITGRVVRIQDSNKILGNYKKMSGYLGHSFALPFRRTEWKGNALKVNVIGKEVESSILLLNDVHMDNTEDHQLTDQIPMGAQGIRIRTNLGAANENYLEFAKCTIKEQNTTVLNCTQHGTRQKIASKQYITKSWWFQESIVVMTGEVLAPSGGSPTRERSRLYCYRKSDGKWTTHDFGLDNNNSNYYSGVIEFIDIKEHEGDLLIAYKSWSHRFITRPIITARADGLDIGTPGGWTRSRMMIVPTTTYNPNDHRTGANGGNGYTDIRFFPLEDDSCFTGLSIVKDTSWKLRFLIDCNLNSYATGGGTSPGRNVWGNTKWIGEYSMFDSSHVDTHRRVWNVTHRPEERSGTDYLGNDFEYGCANSENVFIFDKSSHNGWVVAAVEMKTKSFRYFQIDTFGITGIKDLICVGDFVILIGTSTPAETPSALIVLYGTHLNDARRRIHSIEKIPGTVKALTGVQVDNKIWIRYIMNGRPYYRVAYIDGPIVLYNSTKESLDKTYLSHSNGVNAVNLTQTHVSFEWANNEAKWTNIKMKEFKGSTSKLDNIVKIKGHVYGLETRGLYSNQANIRQRVYFHKNQGELRRRILHSSGVNYRIHGGFDDDRRRFQEIRVKNGKMCRLSYDKYYSRFSFYNDPEKSRHEFWTGYECEFLDFSEDPGNNNHFYWATSCQDTTTKIIRIYRNTLGGGYHADDAGGTLYHNDEVDSLTIDPVFAGRHLLTLKNEKDKLLNMSIYDLGGGVIQGNPGDHRVILPAQDSILLCNISDYSIFQTARFVGIALLPLYSGRVEFRWITKDNGKFTNLLDSGGALFDISEDMAQIDYVDCTDSETVNSDTDIHCVFVGADRSFYQYKISQNLAGGAQDKVKWKYQMYKDYEAMKIIIGSKYIVIKARSRDSFDNTVLTYLRQDGDIGGDGFLYSGLNGTMNGFNEDDWATTKVEFGEYDGENKIFIQNKEDIHAKIYTVGSFKVTMNNDNWHQQKDNCLHVIGSENTECIKFDKLWYRPIPNHPGAIPKKVGLKNDFWWKFFLWTVAVLLLLAVLAYVFFLLKATAKPGVYRKEGEVRYEEASHKKGKIIKEEVFEYRGGRDSSRSTSRKLKFVDNVEEQFMDKRAVVSQEEMYGDFAL